MGGRTTSPTHQLISQHDLTIIEFMDWSIKQGDILDSQADALIVSANVQLNMSGGVGGAILVRYGDEMQKELHKYIADRGLIYVERGTVIKTSSCGTPFRCVVHAVAIDALYVTTHDVLVETIRKSLALCAESGAKSVLLTALGTGYGQYPLEDFADVVRDLLIDEYPPIEKVTIVIKNKYDAEEFRDALFG